MLLLLLLVVVVVVEVVVVTLLLSTNGFEDAVKVTPKDSSIEPSWKSRRFCNPPANSLSTLQRS